MPPFPGVRRDLERRWCVCHIIYLLIKDNGGIHASNYLFSARHVPLESSSEQPISQQRGSTKFSFCKICFSYIPELFESRGVRESRCSLRGEILATILSLRLSIRKFPLAAHEAQRIFVKETMQTSYYKLRNTNDETAIETVIRMNVWLTNGGC